jgi:hypothetical protein
MDNPHADATGSDAISIASPVDLYFSIPPPAAGGQPDAARRLGPRRVKGAGVTGGHHRCRFECERTELNKAGQQR